MSEITFDKEMKTGQWHSESPDYSKAYPTYPVWQPIETAPKDGSHIFLYNELSIPSVCKWVEILEDDFEWEGWQYIDDILAEFSPSGFDAPTHWMPLPAPPTG